MTRSALSAAACAAALLLGTGCTFKVDNPDAGSDAGSQTVGDQCTAIATEFCTQAIGRCGLAGFTLNDCVSNDVPMCCTSTVCSETSLSPQSAIDACKSAIDVVDCNFIANSTLPSSCQGVPKKP